MGMTSQFLAATIDELLAAAPGWARAEYGPYGDQTKVNPFTGKTFTESGFELLTRPPEASEDEQVAELVALEHRAGWGDVSDVLVMLQMQLGPSPEEDRAKLGRPALVGPKDAESWVTEVPSSMTAALAALSAEQLEAVADSVGEALDLDAAPTELLGQLVEVAKRATSTNRQVFCYSTL